MKEFNFIQSQPCNEYQLYKPRVIKRRAVFVGIFFGLMLISSAYYLESHGYHILNSVKEVFSNKSIQVGGGGQVDQDLLARVSELVVLPKNEQPTIATVIDPAQLKGDFFAKAKKGDRVLIFKDTGKAILYDPVANKVVEVAPINGAVGGN